MTPGDWRSVEDKLARLARGAAPARLLSVTLDLAQHPGHAPPSLRDWFVWRRPEQGSACLGLGRALMADSAGDGRFAALRAAQAGLQADWIVEDGAPAPLAAVGFAFGPRGGVPFANACLWVPALQVREEGGRVWATFSCIAAAADGAARRWRALWQALADAQALAPAVPQRIGQRDNPLADRAFLARGAAAVQAINAGLADKLVLTRSVRLRAERPFVPAAALAFLAERHARCAVFGVGRGNRSFIGASPETLLRVDGRRVEVDALAGTAWGPTGGAAALPLDGDKNRREHDLVAQAVAAALTGPCDAIDVPAEPQTLRFGDIAHLCRRIVAARRADTTVFDLIARLHPTPAVGGAPNAATLDWLAAHGDRRGAWYTGGIGWVDAAGDADLAVALRCAQLHGGEATLYAGAGFVAGSDPAQEFAETQAKLQPMQAALAAAGAATAAIRAAA